MYKKIIGILAVSLCLLALPLMANPPHAQIHVQVSSPNGTAQVNVKLLDSSGNMIWETGAHNEDINNSIIKIDLDEHVNGNGVRQTFEEAIMAYDFPDATHLPRIDIYVNDMNTIYKTSYITTVPFAVVANSLDWTDPVNNKIVTNNYTGNVSINGTLQADSIMLTNGTVISSNTTTVLPAGLEEGSGTNALKWGSANTSATGDYASASGWGTVASGDYSTAMGNYTLSAWDNSLVIGKFNKTSSEYDAEADLYFAIGDGLGNMENMKSNILEVGKVSGNNFMYIDGHVSANGSVLATNISGDGSGLTNLTAAELKGSLPAIDGSNLTGISIERVFVTGNNNVAYYSLGNVGIGTETPDKKLSVVGNIGVSGDITLTGDATANGSITAKSFSGEGSGLRKIPANELIGSLPAIDGSNLTGISSERVFVTGNNNVAYYTLGNVGIGTETPDKKLSVVGNIGVSGDIKLTGNATATAFFSSSIQAQDGNGLGLYDDESNGIFIKDKGNVGIGTSDPSDAKFQIDISDSSIPFRINKSFTDGTRTRGWEYVNSALTSGQIANFAFGKSLTSYNTAWIGYEHVADTSASNKMHFGFWDVNNIMTIQANGNVGIGVTDPTEKLEVNGSIMIPAGEAYLTDGSADIAEKFFVSASNTTIEPGMVVIADTQNPGKAKLSNSAYDKKVIGVISGAKGVSPGMILKGQEGTLMDGDQNIAMLGRVWVKSVGLNTGIEIGDFLTSSDTEGHAMKAVDTTQAHGAILGKALTRLNIGETDYVLVLISLQ
ncbi:MAG: hypothetical protein VW378_02430 [bacterium]